IVDAVVAGDLDAGLVNHYYLLQRIAELGEVPAANHFFSDGDPGGLVMATGAGILASSDQPEESAELIRYLLTEASQRHVLVLFEDPVVEVVGTPEGPLPLEGLPTLDISLTATAATLDPAVALIAASGLRGRPPWPRPRPRRHRSLPPAAGGRLHCRCGCWRLRSPSLRSTPSPTWCGRW